MAPTEVRRRGTMRSRHSWKTSPALERGAELGKMNRGKLCIAAHRGDGYISQPNSLAGPRRRDLSCWRQLAGVLRVDERAAAANL